jgi:hypothetical protein
MMRMAAPERTDEHGRVQEFLHPINSRDRFSRSRSIRSGMEA